MSFQSKYCYPGSSVLINNKGIKEQDILDKVEALYTARRLLQLQKKPLQGNFDLKHLKAIHHYIFQDVYPFAGELRNENIAKGNFRFADARFIEPAASELFSNLKIEKQLSGCAHKEFIDRVAYYMAEINVLHPFREGNGRAQREFIRTLALRNGYDLDWSIPDKDKVLNASKLSTSDHRFLNEIISCGITNEKPNIALKKSFRRGPSLELDR